MSYLTKLAEEFEAAAEYHCTKDINKELETSYRNAAKYLRTKAAKDAETCDCFHKETHVVGWETPFNPVYETRPECWGTPEKDSCTCAGLKAKCDLQRYAHEK